MKLSAILLGSAAGLVMASAASAADLPGEAVPAAVDYVKVCDAFGAGFFYIPGTETCLDISGRVRATARWSTNATDGDDADEDADDSQLTLSVDGRVDFDARTATELGTLRSFFRIAASRSYLNADGYVDNRGVGVDAAFIQLGGFTVGYTGSLFNDAVLYGIDDAAAGFGDQWLAQYVAQFGGGFFAGVSVEGANDSLSTSLNTADGWLTPDVVLKAGIADQPWGDFDVSFIYSNDLLWAGADDGYAVKATANIKAMDGVNVRATAGYYSEAFGVDDETTILLGLAGSVAVSDAATVYAGVRYDIDDSWNDGQATENDLFANVGVDYTVVDGLVATAEVSYADVDDDDSISVIGRLTRNW
jgi:hypothetical protein